MSESKTTNTAQELANEILTIGLYVSAHFPTRTDEEIGIHRYNYLKLVSEAIQKRLDAAFSEGFERGHGYDN
jgi:hypothetical protein